MKLAKAFIRNFRRLEEVEVDFEDSETVFVGPNNSGKTSATSIFRCFLSSRDFKIHDFSIERISEIDHYWPEGDIVFPTIELDLWFDFDPENISFGRAFALLSSVSIETYKVGIRCKYAVDDITKLWAEYNTIFPSDDDGNRKRSLSHFLGLDGNFKNHFSVQYSSLSRLDNDEIEETIPVSYTHLTLPTKRIV